MKPLLFFSFFLILHPSVSSAQVKKKIAPSKTKVTTKSSPSKTTTSKAPSTTTTTITNDKTHERVTIQTTTDAKKTDVQLSNTKKETALLTLNHEKKALPYKTAIGFRGGWSSGISLKHNFNTKSSVEILLSTRYWSGFMLTGMYQVHQPIKGNTDFRWYVGAGAHLGVWYNYYSYYYTNLGYNTNSTILVPGVSGIIGVEYTFNLIEQFKFNASLDWKPMLNYVGHASSTDYISFFGGDVALSIRYPF